MYNDTLYSDTHSEVNSAPQYRTLRDYYTSKCFGAPTVITCPAGLTSIVPAFGGVSYDLPNTSFYTSPATNTTNNMGSSTAVNYYNLQSAYPSYPAQCSYCTQALVSNPNPK